ncbi:MAG: flagellar hook-length control protein FliK [Hylemonella sp.]
MSTTPGVNATAPKAATAAGSAAARAEDGPQEAAGFAALLSSAEAEALPLPATEAAPKLPAEADATRADAVLAQPLPLFGVPWPAMPAGPAGQTAELAPAASQGPRLAGVTARLQAQEAAATGTPPPESTPQDAAPSTEPLLQQAELARRAAQQRAKALAAGSEAAEPQQARTRQPALQPQQQAQTLAVASAQSGAAGPTALAAAWMAGGSEAARSWRAREDKTTATTGAPLLAGVDSSQAGAGASAAAGASSALPVPAAAPDAALLTSQRVAEQLSYWVRRGVHNAELELDGPGDGAVQVHIALQGQQARVEFRADLAPTRQLLEDAAPHLRELLAREGLVLADVSVGAYGGERGGQAGGGNPDGRGSARRTLVVEVPAATPAASARVSAAGGRTLDLYV